MDTLGHHEGNLQYSTDVETTGKEWEMYTLLAVDTDVQTHILHTFNFRLVGVKQPVVV